MIVTVCRICNRRLIRDDSGFDACIPCIENSISVMQSGDVWKFYENIIKNSKNKVINSLSCISNIKNDDSLKSLMVELELFDKKIEENEIKNMNIPNLIKEINDFKEELTLHISKKRTANLKLVE
ncbi:hypothetical protein ATY35_20240 [Vibrio cidicii]|uniref:Uncharacterized protein n=2 Tax=Vibrio cidicii TaxID=1763883 RepID=A0ABR5VWL1_9VIBR|nr:hypothetical protein [Vibrio cidicii]KYN80253.1 hypothetical protein ATY35_20240 [Vibrio cidicii]